LPNTPNTFRAPVQWSQSQRKFRAMRAIENPKSEIFGISCNQFRILWHSPLRTRAARAQHVARFCSHPRWATKVGSMCAHGEHKNGTRMAQQSATGHAMSHGFTWCTSYSWKSVLPFSWYTLLSSSLMVFLDGASASSIYEGNESAPAVQTMKLDLSLDRCIQDSLCICLCSSPFYPRFALKLDKLDKSPAVGDLGFQISALQIWSRLQA
jgi:hypothetical protein